MTLIDDDFYVREAIVVGKDTFKSGGVATWVISDTPAKILAVGQQKYSSYKKPFALCPRVAGLTMIPISQLKLLPER